MGELTVGRDQVSVRRQWTRGFPGSASCVLFGGGREIRDALRVQRTQATRGGSDCGWIRARVPGHRPAEVLTPVESGAGTGPDRDHGDLDEHTGRQAGADRGADRLAAGELPPQAALNSANKADR